MERVLPVSEAKKVWNILVQRLSVYGPDTLVPVIKPLMFQSK